MKCLLPPDLQRPLDEFINWRENRKRKYRFKLEQPLFHYTDSDGLMGIIKSDALWFTPINYLNDPSEFHFSYDLAVEELKKAQPQSASDPLAEFFLQRMLGGLDECLRAFSKYVGSFSRDGDDLGQWRSYAENGRGFCLGISECVFAESDLDENPLKNAVPVAIRYDAELAELELQRGVQKALELLRRKEIRETCGQTPNGWKHFLCQLSVAVAHWIYFISVAFKHPAYAAEREVRLLLINEAERLQPHVRVRTRNGEIVPYIPWPFQPSLREKGVLQLIRIGPSAPQSAENAVTELLKSCRMASPPVVICRSQVPYRVI
ncbi:MAG: DUF2971 domain-containing protein [Geminicoccaceae bacterium]